MLVAMCLVSFAPNSAYAIEEVDTQPSINIEQTVETPVEGEEAGDADGEEEQTEEEGALEEEHPGNEFIKNELLPILKEIFISVLTFGGLCALLWKQIKAFYDSIKDFATKSGIATKGVEAAKETLTKEVETAKDEMVKEVANAKEEMEKVKSEIQKSEASILEFKAGLETLQAKLDVFMRADKMAKLNDASLIASGVAKQIEEVYNEIKNG